MSISPSAPEPRESYTYEAASTPRWIFVVFIAAFALIGYVLYAGNDSRTKLESELAQSNSKQAVLAAQIEQTNSVVADLRGKLEVTTQKLGFTQAELSQARTLAQNIRQSQKESDQKLSAEIGLANRLIAPFVQRAYIAFPESQRYFTKALTVQTGVPLRDGFEPAPYAAPEHGLNVLVIGGSQGAKSLNEAVPRALSHLGEGIRVVHQCGRAHEEAARALYAELGFGSRARVAPFIDDMPAALSAADFVIGRAGASAVSEICAVGRPSLLVPYPFAGDHQKLNAISIANEGAALWVPSAEATPVRLASELRVLMDEPAKLVAMAEAARRLGRPKAAHAIAQDLLSLAGVSSAFTPDPSRATPKDDDGFVKAVPVSFAAPTPNAEVA